MSEICVGVRNDATIDVDLKTDDEWGFSNLTLEEAEFLKNELEHAINRAKLRGAILDLRQKDREARKPSWPGNDLRT
jgi:hypothetical protein